VAAALPVPENQGGEVVRSYDPFDVVFIALVWFFLGMIAEYFFMSRQTHKPRKLKWPRSVLAALANREETPEPGLCICPWCEKRREKERNAEAALAKANAEYRRTGAGIMDDPLEKRVSEAVRRFWQQRTKTAFRMRSSSRHCM
jgi:hypothetical protein